MQDYFDELWASPPTTPVQFLYMINGLYHYVTSCCTPSPIHYGIATSTIPITIGRDPCRGGITPTPDGGSVSVPDLGTPLSESISNFSSFYRLPSRRNPRLDGRYNFPSETSVITESVYAKFMKRDDEDFNDIFNDRRYTINEIKTEVTLDLDDDSYTSEVHVFNCDSCRRPSEGDPDLTTFEVTDWYKSRTNSALHVLICRNLSRPVFCTTLTL